MGMEVTMTGNNQANKETNYNERADGYGHGPSESENLDQPYEKEREEKKLKDAEAPTKDENGLPNQHGEVDQYSFRDV